MDPDPLVRGMDPRIRIRIHPKMSWIRNTAKNTEKKSEYLVQCTYTGTVLLYYYIFQTMQ
jgi:hypothetical protein